MKHSSWWLWSLSVVLVLACLAVPFIPIATLPFDGYPVAANKFAVKPSSMGVTFPASLKPGDVIRDDLMDVTSRISIFINNYPPGTQIKLIVERAGQVLHIPVQIARVPRILQNLLLQATSIALAWLEVALGLLILWRGRHRAALGIALWCLTDAITTIVTSLHIPPPLGAYIPLVVYFFLQAPLQLYGLFLVADGLTSEASGTWRRWLVRTFFFSLVLYVAAVLFYWIPYGTSGHALLSGQELYGIYTLHIVCFALPIGMLLLAYRSASMAIRLRMRWIFLSLIMLAAGYLVSRAPALGINLPQLLFAWLSAIFTGAALCGFTYAVLRHQLVPVRLAVNRTLVYAIVTSLVVSLFALVLNFMDHSALGAGTNRILALLIALLLGMGLNAVKRQLDHYLNRLFFRHQRRARAALNNLIRIAADITDRDVLLDKTADELFSQSHACGLSIYVVTGESGEMVRVREQGKLDSPQQINAHDTALLQLRAGDKWIDLHSVNSSLGREGHVFPMRVGHQLIGLVVCGPRTAGQRIPDELKLLANVTLKIAALLYTLDMRAQRELLLRVANGGSKIPKDIQTRAQVLVGTHAAT